MPLSKEITNDTELIDHAIEHEKSEPRPIQYTQKKKRCKCKNEHCVLCSFISRKIQYIYYKKPNILNFATYSIEEKRKVMIIKINKKGQFEFKPILYIYMNKREWIKRFLGYCCPPINILINVENLELLELQKITPMIYKDYIYKLDDGKTYRKLKNWEWDYIVYLRNILSDGSNNANSSLFEFVQDYYNQNY